MGLKESNLSKRILLAVSSMTNAKLFRNNTGTAWTGKTVSSTRDGGKYIDEPRPLRAGLCKGSSDLIGWTPIEITQDMVGKKIGVFTAVEIKARGGKATPEQLNFIEQVRKGGGIAGIATTDDEAVNLITNQLKHR